MRGEEWGETILLGEWNMKGLSAKMGACLHSLERWRKFLLATLLPSITHPSTNF